MLIAFMGKDEIDGLKLKLKTGFEMKNLKEAKKIVWMEIQKNRKLELLRLTQKLYNQKVPTRFSMEKEKQLLYTYLYTYNFLVKALRSQKRTRPIWKKCHMRDGW